MKQEDFLKQILELKNANPNLDIHFCIDHDELAYDSQWTKHKIYKVEVSPWFEHGERIMTDKEEILEQLFDDNPELECLSSDEIEAQLQKIFEKEVGSAICVYTMAG